MSVVIVFAIAASYSIYITVCRYKYKLDKSVYIYDALLILAALLSLRW
nr:MAG TPA: hypothetical protein [Caudoviricetes sp.]